MTGIKDINLPITLNSRFNPGGVRSPLYTSTMTSTVHCLAKFYWMTK